jgi:tRNA threonylcarbamoyladenosine modification (KEOPS) complex Cgi121 subunit
MPLGNSSHTLVRALTDDWLLQIGQFRTKPISDVDLFLHSLSERLGPHVQAVDAERVAGLKHVELAAIQAWEAWTRGLPRAKKLELEFLLRLACTDQISKAIERVGLRVGCRRIFIVLYRRDHVRLEDHLRESGIKVYPTVVKPRLKALLKLYEVDREHLRVVKGLLGVRSGLDALPYCLAEISSLIHP